MRLGKYIGDLFDDIGRYISRNAKKLGIYTTCGAVAAGSTSCGGDDIKRLRVGKIYTVRDASVMYEEDILTGEIEDAYAVLDLGRAGTAPRKNPPGTKPSPKKERWTPDIIIPTSTSTANANKIAYRTEGKAVVIKSLVREGYRKTHNGRKVYITETNNKKDEIRIFKQRLIGPNPKKVPVQSKDTVRIRNNLPN
jgi:hypothetical protein